MKATGGPMEDFLAALPHARHHLLMLDYDGTLAPFRVARDEAAPYPGVVSLLRDLLRTGTRLVLVTGRPAIDLAVMLDLDPPPEIWGVHGLERLFPDGRLERTEIPAPAALALEEAARWTENRGFARFVEVKPGAVALHWRGVDESMAARLRLAASAAFPVFARNGRLELREFDGGLELRAPGPHKGDVVRRLLQESLQESGGPGSAAGGAVGPPSSPGTAAAPAAAFAAAFLGDDFTDEDAFRAVRTARDQPQSAGAALLGVLVRDEDRPTYADARLRPPEALSAFLARWIDATLPAAIMTRSPVAVAGPPAAVAGPTGVGMKAGARHRTDR